ncbi:Uu.00g100230.m01.CDS01 [Anthostomella pinea]|uniref:Autophagy-related protein 2 n=1 Tax=Anthostomella pinea TaxID=933095 RepID=A0AAI8V7V7_9PEZI|nr:Uu.00g100230.m01.CDS01 [Anthostomella pinea]
MATYFQSFLSSSMPKRLLRYSLAKLDFFDTDDLDLDSFDLTWGKNSQVTLQDVGIKIQKLEELLQLPPSIEILKAKALVLRVNVPSAIYTSPITVEADGVEIRLRVDSQEGPKATRKGTSRRKGTRRAGKEEPVPDTIDLAQSFLETQPPKEKAELEAALNAEKHDLAASLSNSEDESEGESPLGTGQALSLPGFLADFLNGITDRLQVAVKGVTCQLDVEMPVEPNLTVNELVTFQIAIDEIIAEGVTMDRAETTAEVPPRIIHKEGKRYVELSKIRACLISEANVFSALSRTPSMPSSVGTSSPAMTSRQPVSRESTSASVSSMPPLGGSLADSTGLEQSHYHHPLMDSEDAFDIPYDLSGSSEDTEDHEADDLRSTPSTPRALVPQAPPRNVPRGDSYMQIAQSAIGAQQDRWAAPLNQTARSEPMLEQPGRWMESSMESQRDHANPPPALGGSDEPLPSPSPSEELAQSTLFSHEEAESMYMSAFSQAEPSEAHHAMPGAWDSEPSSTESSPNSKIKSKSTRLLEDPTKSEQRLWAAEQRSHVQEEAPVVDNLEEAVHQHSDLPQDVSDSASEHVNPSRYEPVAAAGETAADEVATPKGPTRLVKELVSLDTIALYMPSTSKEQQPASSSWRNQDLGSAASPGSMSRSVAPTIPGAFSVYESIQPTASVAEPPRLQASETPLGKSFEVMLSPLEMHVDLSTGFLLGMVVSRILAALKQQSGKPTPEKAAAKSGSSSLPDVKIAADQISIHFLETLSGIADTPERIFNAGPATFGAEALLTATLQNLKIGLSMSNSSTVTSVDLGKFKLRYGNDDILAFDQRIQMRGSVRDAFPSTGSDVSLTITQSPESTKCEVKTLPLHVKIDLQRLDETFSWFGGLSSFLNMSSSMTSNTSPPPRSPTKAPRKSRGVRFDAPIRPDDTSANSDNKVNMRIGGLRLDLIGRDCSVSLDTSAVKLVSREEGVGVGISKVHIAGPHLRRFMGDPPINAVITNTRVEYLITPKDNDLERLLELIIPSKHKFDQNDDEIMVDTLLRQRRKGSVLRVNADDFEVKVAKIQQLQVLPVLGEEVARLATVAKYLPEDDRPGLLVLAHVRNVDVTVDVGGKFGSVQAALKDFELGQITIPSLAALGVGTVSVRRNHSEELVHSVIPPLEKIGHGPILTMRIIGDEMEPVVKLRMRHMNIEYRVPTIMDILGLAEDATPQDFEATLAASVANLGEHAHMTLTGKQTTSAARSDKGKGEDAKPTKVDIILRDCLLGLNPLGLTSKMLIALTDCHVEISLSTGDDAKAVGNLNKASILLIDDVSVSESKDTSRTRRRTSNTSTPQIVELCQQGYVDICYLSSAKVVIQTGVNQGDGGKWVDVELRDDLLVLETCADSTQTLIALANALAPPTPPSKEIKYRTKVVPVQDLLASISADAFGQTEGDYNFDNDFGLAQELGGEDDDSIYLGESGQSSPLAFDSQFYDDPSVQDQLIDPADSMMSERTTAEDTNDGVLLTNFNSQPDLLDEEDLVIHENYFGSGSVVQGTAHRWNSVKNKYDESNNAKVQRSPIAVRVRDVHFIWNLFDGYDWDHTRDVISKAVYDIETTATERLSRHDRARTSTDMEVVEEETVIGDFLFNSIYIGIPANRDPRELAQAINQELNDNATETESIATTAMTATPSRQGGAYRTKKKLRLNRSKRHKITFELKGINVDLVTFPPGSGETQSSVDVRVRDLDVFDHVPTSTWKKFATYDQDAGEREMGTSMAHLEILNVKPVAELAASEIVLKVTLLPLRLHVDQDALDFITRFFEFKNDSAPTHASPSDIPFIQRAEVNSVPVKLDFKPKRVDYAGLRSGHTTEFMNFLVLDQARMTMRHTIIYGVSGFDRLGQTLNDIWMPDVKRNQLPGVLAGLAPVRSLVTVGSGFKDLVEIPIKEYKKDGRIVRSIGKGAAAFAKTTGTEIVKLGAKLAVGTQYALQGAEGILVKQPEAREAVGWDYEDLDTEETKQISLYADQPTGVVQGLRGAYASLARDLNVARDAIIAVPGEVMNSQSAQGAAKAVLKRAPTIIFRPLIGSSKAIGQTLMGATNSLDPQNRRRMDEPFAERGLSDEDKQEMKAQAHDKFVSCGGDGRGMQIKTQASPTLPESCDAEKAWNVLQATGQWAKTLGLGDSDTIPDFVQKALKWDDFSYNREGNAVLGEEGIPLKVEVKPMAKRYKDEKDTPGMYVFLGEHVRIGVMNPVTLGTSQPTPFNVAFESAKELFKICTYDNEKVGQFSAAQDNGPFSVQIGTF